MPNRAPVESKVTWSTGVTLLVSIAIAVLNGYEADGSILPWIPSNLQPILILIIPTLLTFLGGYLAPHTSRPDLVPPPAPGYPVESDEADTPPEHGVS